MSKNRSRSTQLADQQARGDQGRGDVEEVRELGPQVRRESVEDGERDGSAGEAVPVNGAVPANGAAVLVSEAAPGGEVAAEGPGGPMAME